MTTDAHEASNLTLMQLLFWIGQKLQPGLPVYNRIGIFVIPQKIVPEHFQKAFQTLLASCDALRTVVRQVDAIPQQVVLDSLDYQAEYVDFSDSVDPESDFSAWQKARSRVAFDLEQRLFDLALVKMAEERFVCFINFHNIIMDALSAFLIFEHISRLYEDSLKGQLEATVAMPAFQSYVQYERENRASARHRKAEEFWRERLACDPDPVSFYGKRPTGQHAEASRISLHLSAERMKKLRAVIKSKGVFLGTEDLSLLAVLSALQFAYLYGASGSRALSIGVTYHNRITNAFAKTIGVLMQVLPLRVVIAEDETFLSLIRKAAGEILETFKRLPYTLKHPKEYKKNFALLNYVNTPVPSFGQTPTIFEWGHSGYQDEPLVVQVHNLDQLGNLSIELDFSCELFDQQRAQAAEHFTRILDLLLEDVNNPVKGADLLWKHSDEKLSSLEAEATFAFE